MAGWDGDALAERMEDAMERQQQAAEDRAHKEESEGSSAEGRARIAEIESLRLSRARILDQLGGATNPARRAMLERALQSIEGEMEV
ncbi:MAG TPA: hypothetical protein VM934_05830 [Pyrinomonadaceae bacterium]|jgi:hypothetical protein|nr:hypothetical protein [Pyrinomonadaceae bacterium]